MPRDGVIGPLSARRGIRSESCLSWTGRCQSRWRWSWSWRPSLPRRRDVRGDRQKGVPAMCGIVGYTGYRKATPILLEGLLRLEYRGYDSAGIAMVDHAQRRATKAAGGLSGWRAPAGPPADAAAGIGHTRWATHGEPSYLNARPHTD